jgi:tRNA threonylcarbamoyladenosine biosynthesis protein TsaE
MEITTCSLKETQLSGQKIGVLIENRTIIALTGDLGAGKTSFVQGLARGLDVPQDYYITSPTYTLINEYPGRFPLFHVDIYRLGETVDFDEIGLYEILQSNGVVAIEWADKLHDLTLTGYLAVSLKITGNESRRIRLTGYGSEASDLLKKIEKIYKEPTHKLSRK